MKNKFTKYEKELRNVCKGTSKAILSISQEWFADCDMRKINDGITRLMGWENRINNLVGKYK